MLEQFNCHIADIPEHKLIEVSMTFVIVELQMQ